ncbi:MAG: hypothetical protein HS104_28645 [Polyangiaceae bacterium]|nr:hypothetical protein [Polyangiaceae bacterium]MCL4753828.1 hypothetical protein [Myxococcales bacterium]
MATEKHTEKSSPVPAILVLLGVVGVGGFIAVTNFTASAEQAKLENQAIDIERGAKDLRLQQQGELVAPVSWADKGKGTAAIPVERAMSIVVKTLQANPAAATPAPPPPPEPAADAGDDASAADGEAGDAGETAADAGAASTDAGAPAADAAAPVAPKPAPVAPKPPPVAPQEPAPPTTP